MQLRLNVERMDSYDTLLDTDIFQEETMELIVPDSNADIRRIIDVNGQIRLTGKTTHDGVAVVSGVLDTWVIYEPENDRGMCCITSKIQFSLQQEGKEIKSDTVCVATPVLRGIDAKALNPRKLLIRADVGAQIKLYQPYQAQLCTGICQENESTVQQLHKECAVLHVADVLEKEFSVRDEVRLQAGPAGQGELISTAVAALCTSSKVIGNKLVLKGEARVAVHYLVEDHIYCASSSIPFSQIMDIEHVGEAAECMVDMCVTALSSQQAGMDGRTGEVDINLLAQIAVVDKRPLRLLCDAYSTKGNVRLEHTEYMLRTLAEHAQCVKNVSETLQTDSRVRSMVDCTVVPLQVLRTREQHDICLEGQFRVRAMFLDENGTTHCLVRNVVVTGRLENPTGSIGWLQCSCPGEVYATASADGIDVRFDVEFRWTMVTDNPERNITLAELDEEEAEGDHGACVVLRMPSEEEDLWQIAKCFRTTTGAICRANELECDELPKGRMLLIPRCSN